MSLIKAFVSRLAARISWVLLPALFPALLLTSVATAEQPGQTRGSVQFTVSHHHDRPSLVEIRLEPPIGRRELYVDMQSGDARRGAGVWTRRRLQAVESGLYRLEHAFPHAGAWGFYVHYGSGLAGFDAYRVIDLSLVPSRSEGGQASFRPFPAGVAALPAYVQPLGYSSFALLVAVLVFSVWRILQRLRGQLAQNHARF